MATVEIWVSDLKGNKVEDSEIEVNISGEEVQPDRVVRLLVADELPQFDLTSGLYLLCCQVGGLTVKLPFYIREPKARRDLGDSPSAQATTGTGRDRDAH